MAQQSPRFLKAALFAAIAWTAGIFIACLWPGEKLPHSQIPFIDKWTHFVLFGGFSLLWRIALPGSGILRMIAFTAAATLVGSLVEWLQWALPQLGRSGDLIDALADMLGGFLGAFAYEAFLRFAPGRERQQPGPRSPRS